MNNIKGLQPPLTVTQAYIHPPNFEHMESIKSTKQIKTRANSSHESSCVVITVSNQNLTEAAASQAPSYTASNLKSTTIQKELRFNYIITPFYYDDSGSDEFCLIIKYDHVLFL